MRARTTTLALALVAAGAFPAAAQVTPGTVPGTFQGPTSSQTPFVVPAADGWEVVSLISAGDPAKNNGYRMVGIPDGLGAVAGKFEAGRWGRYVADEKYMTVFMNHEIPAGGGIARAHGQNGAFVSQWTIQLNTLQVKAGEDLIQDVYTWDTASGQYVFNPTAQFNRFCSADLAEFTAFYNPRTGKGFYGRLFMNGEEAGNEGRAFAHVITGSGKGDSYQLASLGRLSYENSVASPNSGDKTLVVSMDDSTPGQVYVYLGNKQKTGNPVERAGLVGGKLFGIKVTNGGTSYSGGAVTRENNGPINGAFSLVEVSDVATGTGAALQTASTARGITEFARPEDGAWDTLNPRVFYFVITGATIDGKLQSARLYKLTFDSISNPTGGTIEPIIDRNDLLPSTTGFAQFDNLTVDSDGFVLIQEDPGNQAYLAQTWRVNPATKTATAIFHSDAARFGSPAPAPFNLDEESSGIIEVTDIVRSARWYERGRRYFLADMQAHYAISGELFEGGQLYLIASPKAPRRHFDDDDDDRGRDNGGWDNDHHGHDDED